MTPQNNYVFMPKFSIQPNQISLFNEVFIKNRATETLRSLKEKSNIIKNNTNTVQSNNKVKRKHHNFKISDNAVRNIKKKINWLYYLSKKKNITTYNGKKIYNFKCGFITLTLPSKQDEPTAVITKKYLNQFLTEIKQRTKMQNYIWRLEFQKNKNVHYHIITDTYIDYYLVKKIWNRILAKGNYINKFQEKFINMNLSEYNKLTNHTNKTEYKVIAKRYAKGKREKWLNPPSVDTRTIVDNKAMSAYLSKYFSKNEKDDNPQNDLDTIENSENMRLWYASRTLSKLKSVSDFCEAVKYSASTLVEGVKNVRKVLFKYAVVYYFDIEKLPNKISDILNGLLLNYSKSLNYIPST